MSAIHGTGYVDPRTGIVHEVYGPYFWIHEPSGFGGSIRAVMYMPWTRAGISAPAPIRP
jgi:hypothetical protein